MKKIFNVGVRVQGLGFEGLGFRVQGLGFRVWGLGIRVQGLGFRVQSSGLGGIKLQTPPTCSQSIVASTRVLQCRGLNSYIPILVWGGEGSL